VFADLLWITETLYPKGSFPRGHPYLPISLNNLGALHYARGEYAKAKRLYRRALEMNEALYPEERFPHGHVELAKSLNNLALLHQVQGEYGKAERLYRRALKMNEALYPKERFPHGHSDLATTSTISPRSTTTRGNTPRRSNFSNAP
jgi:tetratricopeptide (TPR) repeat protein